MNVDNFIALIREADADRLWSRNQIEEWEIPYIFLAWNEWPPVRNNKGEILRAEWLRFWFDSRVRTFEDIWIRTEGDPRIIKATYRNPDRARIPSLQHLEDTKTLYIDRDFLQANYRPPVDYVATKLHQAFPNEVEAP